MKKKVNTSVLEKASKQTDIAIEVVDSRKIDQTRIKFYEEKFKDKLLIIATKIDLVNEEKKQEVLKKINLLNAISMNLKKNKKKHIINKLEDMRIKKFKKNKKIKVFVFGYPNVGKSTLINLLCDGAKAKTGFKPGITKNIQWIKLNENILLYDTPGIIRKFEKESDLAKKSAMSFDKIKNPILVVREIYNEFNKNEKKECEVFYDILKDNEIIDYYELLKRICKRRGFLLKKQELDIQKAARIFINDYQKFNFKKNKKT